MRVTLPPYIFLFSVAWMFFCVFISERFQKKAFRFLKPGTKPIIARYYFIGYYEGGARLGIIAHLWLLLGFGASILIFGMPVGQLPAPCTEPCSAQPGALGPMDSSGAEKSAQPDKPASQAPR